MPLAPARFSTTTDWPRLSVNFADRIRAATSVPPPAAKPTRILTGLSGYRAGCAFTCAIARPVPIVRPSDQMILCAKLALFVILSAPKKEMAAPFKAARPSRFIGCSLLGLSLELSQVGIVAERHRHHLARARIAEHDFELAARQVA